MPPFIDHYSILGISSTATHAAIRSTYRRLALAHHPDRAEHKDKAHATAKFAEIAVAYGVLADSRSRRDYDALYQRERDKSRRRAKKLSTRRNQSATAETRAKSSEKLEWDLEPDVDGSFGTGHAVFGGPAENLAAEGEDDDESCENGDYADEPRKQAGGEEEYREANNSYNVSGIFEQNHSVEKHPQGTSQHATEEHIKAEEDIDSQLELHQISNPIYLPIAPIDSNPQVPSQTLSKDYYEVDYHDPDRWAALGAQEAPTATAKNLGDGTEDLLTALASTARSHRQERPIRGLTLRGATAATRRQRDEHLAQLTSRLDRLAIRAHNRTRDLLSSPDHTRRDDLTLSISRRIDAVRAAMARLRMRMSVRLRVLWGEQGFVVPARWNPGDEQARAVVRGLERDADVLKRMEALCAEAEGEVDGLEACGRGVELGLSAEARLLVRYLLFDLDEWGKIGEERC